MIQIENIEYKEPLGKTQFKCTFTRSGLQIIFESALPGDLTEAQIIEGMQGEYDKWIERNNIP